MSIKTSFLRFNSCSIISKSRFCSSMEKSNPEIQKISPNQILKEGKAEIVVQSTNVFYNPVQEFNRDLSVAVLNVYSEEHYHDLRNNQRKKDLLKTQSDIITGISSVLKDEGLLVGSPQKDGLKILEALSATGLRSIRYAREVHGIESIVANDLSLAAVESIKFNVKHNNVEDLIQTSHDDACILMCKHKRYPNQFNVVDLDPYGCASIFLDGAVQCVDDGGLLLVTATDMAILAGNSPETCYSKYGAISLKSKACHEMALRILLQCIESHANRYGRYITPLLSLSADFYIRVFVKVRTGPIYCKKSTSKLSMVYQCVGCETFTLQPLGGFKPNPSEKDPLRTKGYLPSAPPVSLHCQHCNQKHHMGGPIWSDHLHDSDFVTRVLQHVEKEPERYNTSRRIMGTLSVIHEELLDSPLYYTNQHLSSKLHLESIPIITIRSAIINAGYKVSFSHACKNSIKTNAPATLIWDIMREWEKTHPIKEKKLNADLTAQFILKQAMTSSVDFSLRMDANPISRKEGFLRFQYNPTPNWGPGTRATTNMNEDKLSKSKLNQNRNSRKDKIVTKREISPHLMPSEDPTKHIKLTTDNLVSESN